MIPPIKQLTVHNRPTTLPNEAALVCLTPSSGNLVRFRLEAGGPPLVLGRGRCCQLRFLGNSTSSNHCDIKLLAPSMGVMQLIIKDTSANGTGLRGPAIGALLQQLTKDEVTPLDLNSMIVFPLRQASEIDKCFEVHIEASQASKPSANAGHKTSHCIEQRVVSWQ